jgi:hypothetical protein
VLAAGTRYGDDQAIAELALEVGLPFQSEVLLGGESWYGRGGRHGISFRTVMEVSSLFYADPQVVATSPGLLIHSPGQRTPQRKSGRARRGSR